MIKVLVIEDEPRARAGIILALKKYDDIDVVDECGDLFSAMKLIRQHKPDVIFLDICLPGHDYDVPMHDKEWAPLGLTLLDYIGIDEYQPHVVIVSAYSRYALQAIEANVLDYLHKPVSDDRLEKTIERIREKGQHVAYPDRPFERIPVYSNNRVRFIKLDDIEYVESKGAAGIHVVCEERSYYTELTLKVILQKTNFFQTHRQYIINPNWVLELECIEDTGRAVVYTRSKKEVPVSRGFKKAVMQKLGLKDED
ncbi:MAG: response regulator [Methylococcales bacterium]|nr:response regulator [Methylococcales bacterium]